MTARCWCGRGVSYNGVECAEHDDPPPQRNGCTGCGSLNTVTIDGVRGRRCADCPPSPSAKHLTALVDDQLDVGPYVRTVATLPPGGYHRGLADDLVEMGRADAAFTYLGAFLAHEIDRRFTAAARRVEPFAAAAERIVVGLRVGAA